MLTGKEEGRATKYNHIEILMHSDDHIKNFVLREHPSTFL